MGRLTRLNEHVVESVAVEKTPEEEWRSNGLLSIQWRSNHMAVIKDLARKQSVPGDTLTLLSNSKAKVVVIGAQKAQEYDPVTAEEWPQEVWEEVASVTIDTEKVKELIDQGLLDLADAERAAKKREPKTPQVRIEWRL